MSGSQVFYMGDNGEVLTWDGTGPDPIKPGVEFCATVADDPTVGPIDYDIGYAQALKDVLEHCIREGKQHLVQWLEARLKDLP